MFRDSDSNGKSLWASVLRLGVAVLAGVCLASPAAADCSVKSGYALGTATITLPAALSIPRDTVVGSVLYDSNWVPTNATYASCSGSGQMSWGYASAMTLVPGYTNVYQTGVSGIGIKVGWVNSTAGPADIDGSKVQAWPNATANYGTNNYGPMGLYRVQLIVTGPVSTGTFNLPSTLAQGTYGSALINQLTLANNVEPIMAPACSVQTSSLAITMPQARAAALPDISSTTGDTRFNLSLNCAAPVTIAVTFTDASQPGNTSSTLSLSQASTAAGVGYQIIYNGTPISYGPDSSAIGNVNQFSLGAAREAGIVNFPFSVRYVRTGTMSPGTANALATFTMSYQ
jgi:type 1 fimbria pilin